MFRTDGRHAPSASSQELRLAQHVLPCPRTSELSGPSTFCLHFISIFTSLTLSLHCLTTLVTLNSSSPEDPAPRCTSLFQMLLQISVHRTALRTGISAALQRCSPLSGPALPPVALSSVSSSAIHCVHDSCATLSLSHHAFNPASLTSNVNLKGSMFKKKSSSHTLKNLQFLSISFLSWGLI